MKVYGFRACRGGLAVAAAVALAAIMPAVASAAPTITVGVDGSPLTVVGDASANTRVTYGA
jgi:hypothetical protein